MNAIGRAAAAVLRNGWGILLLIVAGRAGSRRWTSIPS
jgi:hypothetical protein